jgi:nitric oxide reductase large subunit
MSSVCVGHFVACRHGSGVSKTSVIQSAWLSNSSWLRTVADISRHAVLDYYRQRRLGFWQVMGTISID